MVRGDHLPGFVREVHRRFWASTPLEGSGFAQDLCWVATDLLHEQPETMTLQLLRDVYLNAQLVYFDEEGFIQYMREEFATSIDDKGLLRAVLVCLVRQILIDGWLEQDDELGKAKWEDERRRRLELEALGSRRTR